MKKKNLLILVLATFFLLPTLVSATVNNNISLKTSLTLVKDWQRHEIVWMTGYDFDVGDFSPWKAGPNFGLALMYEPLFGYDKYTDAYIPVIGTSFSWQAGGSELLVTITNQATWSDGQVLDIDDVIFSYNLAADQPKFSADLTARVDSITKVSDYSMTMNIAAGYENSLKVIEFISLEIPIVPEHVWKHIITIENGGNRDLTGYLNNWHTIGYNTSWMVCSGPYLPHYELVPVEEVFIYRDDWWGAGIIDADLPSRIDGKTPPKYVGARKYSINPVKDAALIAGAVDGHAGFIAEVWTIMNDHPNVNTWYGRQNALGIDGNYFIGLGSVLSIAPNHAVAPLNETYVREAIAYCLNNDPLPNIAAYGYWDRAEATFIDPTSPYYNETIANTYRRDYNVAQARQTLLDAGCVKIDDGGGLYHWETPYGMTIGPFDLITVDGWTDVKTACDYWAVSMNDINISVTVVEQPQATFETNLEIRNFDMCMQTRTPHLTNPALTFFDGYRGPNFFDKNVSGWVSPAFDNAFVNFELSGSDPDLAMYWASQMQLLLATELPEIPCFNNAFWYAFSTTYWEGWNSAVNQFEQPISPNTVNVMALKARFVLNLYSTGAVSGEFPWLIIGGIIAAVSIVGIVAVVGIVRVRKKRSL